MVRNGKAEMAKCVARQVGGMIWIDRPAINADGAIVASAFDELFAYLMTVAADALHLAVPEFLRIAEMALDMIDDVGRRDLAVAFADHA